ncbi:MAG: pseudouridine synthase [Bacilli bacterium]|jgi:23S rRNA pseudouridine1911/1915/1917 synthase|nr:pseudouridine synthase [Bacilli bacterium]MDD2681519.1 pseudouridine synthase [Bacilli bacterium]MDD3121052.1 pseudouridine synthase [Bacilli bacterium]MDD4063226.1 pseudouridine synthase [Bacilli bacterium]MDD4481866.1 pseudouridine synthase [Bacilli bacterium]
MNIAYYVKQLDVLYEDNHIIVVTKYRDILSQEDSTGDLDMLSIVKAYLKEKYNKPGAVFLGLVHRLDRRVGGVMVFAKTSKGASRLSDSIRKKEMGKKYLAIVKGYLQGSGTFIDKINKENKKAVISDFGVESVLNYNVIRNFYLDNIIYTVVEVELITGRYNQIRIQFSSRGLPLLNDFKYDYRGTNYNNEIGLWSYELTLIHPISKERLFFKKEPDGQIWKY